MINRDRTGAWSRYFVREVGNLFEVVVLKVGEDGVAVADSERVVATSNSRESAARSAHFYQRTYDNVRAEAMAEPDE